MIDSGPGATVRWRVVAVRVIGILALLTFSFMFVIVAAEAAGIISMEPTGSVDDPPPSAAARAGAAAPREAVHVAGALAVIGVGATGLIALMIHPRAAGRKHHVLSATIGMLAVVPIVGNPDNFGGQAGLVDPAFVVLGVPPLVVAVLAPGGRDGAGHRVVRPLMLLAAIAVVPLLAFGVDQALMQRNTFPPTADPHHQAHWYAMAVFAFVVLVVVGTAALGAAGWRLAAASAALATAAVAITSFGVTEAASSFGRLGGGVALLWAVCVLAVVVRPGQGTAPSPNRQDRVSPSSPDRGVRHS